MVLEPPDPRAHEQRSGGSGAENSMHTRSVRSSILIQAVVLTAVLFGLYVLSRYNYVLMHSVVELFSIVVACSIFMIAWNTRRFLANNYILFVGISFLYVSLLDLLHTLSYNGLNVFPGFDSNLPTQLWIAARFMGSVSLVIAPLVMGRRLRPGGIFGAYAAATVLLLAAIFVWRIFPDCYIEGKGLTKFKIVSEYVISLFFVAALALLILRRADFERTALVLLSISILFRITTELLFTRYVGVDDNVNLAGHFFKVLAFYLFYKALVEAALVRPYELLFRDLKRSEEDLRDERDRVQNYLDVARTILLVINTDQRVSLINRMGCEILGRPESDIIGKNWFDHFVPPARREEVRGAFAQIMSGAVEHAEHFENPVLVRDGEERLIAWHNTVLRDGAGRIIATLSSGSDITARRAVEDALATKTRELERSNAELDQFASTVSHDLKEPLSTIGGFAEVLQERYEEKLDEKGMDYLARISGAALRMERLISDLLAYARVTTRGREFGRVATEKVVRMAMENLRMALDESNAQVRFEGLPTVNADETQLLELFQNLIGNAIKYRGAAPLQITIAAERSGEGAWHFSVADNGMGIDAKHHLMIFRIFERVHRGAQYPGTGVGLALCKKIVERHGGRIWVESEQGKGARFRFILPET